MERRRGGGGIKEIYFGAYNIMEISIDNIRYLELFFSPIFFRETKISTLRESSDEKSYSSTNQLLINFQPARN